MSRFVWTAIALGLLVVCSCSQQDADTPASDAGTPAPVEYSPMAGTEIAVGDGARATVISVGDFDANTQALAGLVAVEGRVSESFTDKDAFILIDCSTKAGCASSCCPQAKLPIRLTAGGYTGDLPREGESVIVIGDLTVTGTGYQLDVIETRRGSETLLRKAGV